MRQLRVKYQPKDIGCRRLRRVDDIPIGILLHTVFDDIGLHTEIHASVRIAQPERTVGLPEATAKQKLLPVPDLYARHALASELILRPRRRVFFDRIGTIGLPITAEAHGFICRYGKLRLLSPEFAGIDRNAVFLSGNKNRVLIQNAHARDRHMVDHCEHQRHREQQKQEPLLVAI